MVNGVSVKHFTPSVDATQQTRSRFGPYTISDALRERYPRLVLGMNDQKIREANRIRGTYDVEVLW